MSERTADQRVVITGRGAITPGGLTVAENHRGLLKGRSFITRLEEPFVPDIVVGGQVAKDFNPNLYVSSRDQKGVTRDVLLAQAAAIQAVVEAGYLDSVQVLPPKTKEQIANRDEPWLQSDVLARRVGIEIGTAVGGSISIKDQKRDSRSILRFDISQAVGSPAIWLDARGPGNTRVNACAASVIAIGEAANRIRSGQVDLMLAGGAEAALSWNIYNDFDRMNHALSRRKQPERASRPLNKLTEEDGFVPSEGSAMFVLESLKHAQDRGARIYAEVLGFAQTTDTSSAFVPGGFATEEAIKLAIEDAGRDLKDFDHATLHAAGTAAGDPQETMAIWRTFGRYAPKLRINTPKSYYGHALGDAGANAVLQTTLEMEHEVVFRNPNQNNRIEEAEGLTLPQRPHQYRPTLSVAIGIGLHGVNSALVLAAH